MNIYIKTLGVFDIMHDGNSLIQKEKRTYKIHRLLQYFLAFRNRKILPETIIENLFSEIEYNDPKNVLRTQIFRLRKALNDIIPPGEDMSKYLDVKFSSGNYILEIGDNVDIDIDNFENLIKKGNKESYNNRDNALDLYLEALNEYTGMFLEENAYEVWLTPIRNYYNRLYVKAVFETIDIYKEKESHEEIARICEKALQYAPYDEDIHICLMESMLRLGRFSAVVHHYEYVVDLLNREMGITSSPKLEKFYKKIKITISEKRKMTLIDFWSKFDIKPPTGAMQCDFNDFKTIVDNQMRKNQREDVNDYISIVTLDYDKADKTVISKWAKEMSIILKEHLRKGDAFTFWNDKQILVLLYNVKKDALLVIEERLSNIIKRKLRGSNYATTIKFKNLSKIKYEK